MDKSSSLSGSNKRWQLYPQNASLSEKLGASLQTHPIVGQILLNRNIRSLSEAASYLRPSLDSLLALPPDFTGPVIHRLKEAITQKQHILLYGDYDVDGMTSSAIMSEALSQLGAKVTIYLPNRFTDGYGLNASIVDRIKRENADLLVCLDCGISNAYEVDLIRANTKADVIILDHHTLPETLPNALILNPKTLDPKHPAYQVCTAGLVYLLLISAQFPGIDAAEFADIAALGTVADVVPLIGANRAIVSQGLPLLSERRRPGILALLTTAKNFKPEITVRDIGFVLAPRLNSSGRLGNPLLGCRLLREKNHDTALQIAQKLELSNQERKLIGESMFKAALEQVESTPNFDDQHIVVVRGPQWHAGVIGITASRLTERFSKPTVVIAEDNELGRGSARTLGDIDIYALLKETSSYFKTFGGHTKAAGFSIDPTQIQAFQEQLHAVCKTQIAKSQLASIIEIDAQLTPKDMTLDLAKTLKMLEPFGEANPLPIFYTDELTAIDFKAVGDGTHMKATFTNTSESLYIDGIGFGLSHKMEHLYRSQFRLAFSLEVNEWQQKEKVQIQILDIK